MKNEDGFSSAAEDEYKNRFNIKTLILVMFLIFMAAVFIFWNPVLDEDYHAIRVNTLTAQVLTQERPGSLSTPIPAQYVEYPNQTNGILLGSVVIVLVIIGGTLSVIQNRK